MDAPNVGRSTSDELRTGAAEFRLVEGKKNKRNAADGHLHDSLSHLSRGQSRTREIYAGLRILDPKFSTPRMKAAFTRP